MKSKITALMTIIFASFSSTLLAQGSPESTTSLSHTINGAGIVIESPASVSLGAAQTITGNAAGLASIDAISKTFTVSVLDRRGTFSPLTIDVAITALKKLDATGSGQHVRPTNVIALNAAGTTPAGVAFAANTRVTGDTVVQTTNFVTAPKYINRSFTFDVEVTAEAQTGTDVQAGEYTGQIVFTIS